MECRRGLRRARRERRQPACAAAPCAEPRPRRAGELPRLRGDGAGGRSDRLVRVRSDLDVDLDRGAVLRERAQHGLVALEAADRCRQQLLEPAREHRLRADEVGHAAVEVGDRRVDRSDHHLVAQHEALVDRIRPDFGRALAAGDAREHQHAVLPQRLGGLERDRAESRRLEDQVERPVAGSRVRDGRVLCADVARAELLDQLAVAVRRCPPRQARHVEPAQAEQERGEQPDRSGADHRGLARLPDLQPALDLVGLVDTLLGNGRWLEQHTDLAQRVWKGHDPAGILDVLLGQVAVEEVDPTLVVDVVRGEVLEPDPVVDAVARPPHCRDDVTSRPDRVRDVRPDLEHATEALVAGNQKALAGRRFTVLGRVDLLVRPVDADAEDLHQHAPTVLDHFHPRLWDVLEMHRVRSARIDGDRLHAAPFARRSALQSPREVVRYGGVTFGPRRRRFPYDRGREPNAAARAAEQGVGRGDHRLLRRPAPGGGAPPVRAPLARLWRVPELRRADARDDPPDGGARRGRRPGRRPRAAARGLPRLERRAARVAAKPLIRKVAVAVRSETAVFEARVRLARRARLGVNARAVLPRDVVDRIDERAALPARTDRDVDAGPISRGDDDVLRLRGQWTKSHVWRRRSSPSATRIASPATTRKSSWASSAWYMAPGWPGWRTLTLIPSWSKRAFSPSKKQAEPSSAVWYQRASRAFRTNQPSPAGWSPFSSRARGASGTTGEGRWLMPQELSSDVAGRTARWRRALRRSPWWWWSSSWS